ncbi:MAG: glycosyltransferase family 4 protein [Chloroflexi bacterium]|nr:glycosyltransferase family 4 protein [Chloroflexota bacterium]
MRLGISGFFLDKPATGSGQYTRHLVNELGKLEGEDTIVFRPPWAQSPANEGEGHLKQVVLPLPLEDNLGKLWFEQVALPRACQRYNIDLLHVPYFGPPIFKPCPTVVTIHDLIMLILPQYRGSLLVRLYTALASKAAKRANLIIADSQCTKKDIIRLLGIEETKIKVIYLGCEDSFKPSDDPVAWDGLRQQYGLTDRFILYLGGWDQRKNVASLIRAFAPLEGPWQLAIAGEIPPSRSPLFPNLNQIVAAMKVQSRVNFLGFVSEDVQPLLYSKATLFVFPSLYEGFGLTPLEAMACGAPTLCSNAASLPEVVGEGAHLFDPRKEGDLEHSLALLLADEGLRSELKKRGLKRAQRFSWPRTVAETLAAYQDASDCTQKCLR